VKVATIDMDASPNVAARYGVRAAPTVIVFCGGERKAQHVGLTTKQKLLAMLEA
jgi:thioredoxin 1